MSKLFGLGRQASEFVRRRMSQQTQKADRQIDWQQSSRYVESRRSTWQKLGDLIFGRTDRQYPPRPPGPVTPPPVEPPPIESGGPPRPPTKPPGPTTGFPDGPDDNGRIGPDGVDYGRELGYGDIQLLGRDASYDPADWQVVMDQMRRTPGSSNVYGYYFEFESRTQGILYVTFLDTNSDGSRSGPGPTYGYYDVPAKKYHEFKKATAASAGTAVWDYLRVRGTVWAHQHNYRLIQPGGDYIPRKATRLGFRTRHVPTPGVGRREYRRSTLPERLFAMPDRGEPDRGEPDRG